MEVNIDPERHVKPLKAEVSASTSGVVKYVTIGKYTYSEAGDYVKIDLPIGAGADKEKNRITVDFFERSFEIKIHDF